MFKIKFTWVNICIAILAIILIALLIYLIVKKIKAKKIEGFINNKPQPFPGGMNLVDQILFINLDKRQDRLESITKQLEEQKVDMNKVHRISAHYTPGNGHLGCAKSHLDALKYASENGFNNVLILEDDFKFNTKPEQTHKMFNDLFEKINNKQWDVVMLTHMYGKEKDTQFSFLKEVKKAQTSSGYLINREYYPILIKTFEKSVKNMPSDKTSGVNWEEWALDQAWKPNQEADRWFVFSPFIGKQDEELGSTIQEITNYNNNQK